MCIIRLKIQIELVIWMIVMIIMDYVIGMKVQNIINIDNNHSFRLNRKYRVEMEIIPKYIKVNRWNRIIWNMVIRWIRGWLEWMIIIRLVRDR